MKRVAVFAILVALAGPAVQAGVLSDAYVFPVVVRSTGAAGSFWATELCINNPRSDNLTVVVGLFQDGGVADLAVYDLDGWEVRCSSDFLLGWFGLGKWTGALLVYAPEDENPRLDSLYFSAAVRVFNDQPGGTFGLNVEPEIDVGMYGGSFIGDPTLFGCASGLQNYGSAGVNGFRTSVGFFNTQDIGQNLTVMTYDEDGDVMWEEDYWVPAFTQIQMKVPKNVTISGGGVDVNHDGDQWVLGYMTVTDNRSGDGLYRPLQVLYTGMEKSRTDDALAGLQNACEKHRSFDASQPAQD
jgi:hypothetical protein